MCVSSIQHGGIETFWDRKLCMNLLAWFFCQNVSKCIKQFRIKKCIDKDLIKFKNFINFWVKMFQYPRGVNYFNTARPKYVRGGKMFWYPQTKICLRGQNVSIPLKQNMSQGAKCFNTPKAKHVPGGQNISIPPHQNMSQRDKMFQYPHIVHHF